MPDLTFILTIAVPDTRVGERRHSSIRETRAPGGTLSDSRNRCGSIGSAAAAASRTVVTSLVSTVMPASSKVWVNASEVY